LQSDATTTVILAKARIQCVTRGAQHRKFALRAGTNLDSGFRQNDDVVIRFFCFIKN
jgi:hypothetical protein